MTPAVIPDAPYRADSTFVGRANELRLFRDAFDRMLGGRRQVVTLLGEPGIGKTRCAEVLASAAEDRGALVLWGRCYEEPGAPPYWPWVQILREYMDASSPDEVRVMMGAGLDDIACIVPEPAAGGEKAATTRSMIAEPPQTRFRAFDAIGRFFVKAAQQTPLVLVIDNLHWADAPSLSLLEFLSQELQRCRVLIIGTYRDNEVSRKSPLLSTLGELSRESGIERVRLSGLPEDDIAELAGQMLGAPLPRSAVEAINHQTDGNPLFVIELVKVLIEESADVGVAPIAVRIPDGVRETVGRRLSRLPERCNELLAAASVLGRNFTAKELAAAADESLDLVLANLDTAARAGIVECHGDEPGSHRFTHALIRGNAL